MLRQLVILQHENRHVVDERHVTRAGAAAKLHRGHAGADEPRGAAAAHERSRAIRVEVLVHGVAGQVADLLGLTDQPAPAPSMQAERERARAVGYRLL